jgi:dolichyl-phosphate-mannose-protein mannosyltransferase
VRCTVKGNVAAVILISLFAIAVRLVDINQPFIDAWSWRQSDVASIARNYLRNGFNFAYPQIDWAGDQAGYVGTEFPILPFIAAICYKFVGVHEWVGRLQSLIFFAASLPFLFLIIQQVFGPTAAMWGLFFYSFAPSSVMASRCFMPDMPSLSLAIIGLYFFWRWTISDKLKFLFASAASISLSILTKLPNVIIGAPVFFLAVVAVSDRHSNVLQEYGGHRPPLQFERLRRWELWFFAAIALLPSAVWYWHAYEIAQKFYPHHLFGAGGVQLMRPSWYINIVRETVESSLTPLLVAFAAFYLLARGPAARAGLFHAWLGAMILFIIVVGYGNRHPWYRLPLVPICAAYAGVTWAWIAERLTGRFAFRATAALTVVLFAISSYISLKNFYLEKAANLRLVALELRRITPQESLIVAADYGDPTIFYYAERRGWHFMEDGAIYNGHPTNSAEAIADLAALRTRGATNFVLYSGSFWWLDYYRDFAEYLEQTASVLEVTPEFEIFKLDQAR